MICCRTQNEHFIRAVLMQPDFSSSFEDGITPQLMDIETESELWLSFSDEQRIIGVMHSKPVNLTTLDCHIQILRRYRGKKALEAVCMFYQWCDEQLPEQINKLQTTVPTSLKHVNHFCRLIGMQLEGTAREATRINGQFVDLNSYGITRREMRERVKQWIQ